MTQNDQEPTCENCGKALFGRTDKRFCHDSCRNEFNRKKRAAEQIAEYENLPEILKIIKRNHEILKTYKLEQSDPGDTITVSRSELLNKGYHFKFFTSLGMYMKGKIWKFCFDYGIKEGSYSLADHYCEITYNLKQIDTGNANTFIMLK